MLEKQQTQKERTTKFTKSTKKPFLNGVSLGVLGELGGSQFLLWLLACPLAQ
jgi:hypothetical protein